jgi:hypothetical protein
MGITLSEDDSIAYLCGGWDALTIEDRTAWDLALQGVDSCVAVVLSDGTVAFYMEAGRVL